MKDLTILNEDNLSAIKNGNVEILKLFDKKGLILSDNESLEQFVKRLESLKLKWQQFKDELSVSNGVKIETLQFAKKDLIPAKEFNKPTKITNKLYDFSIEWVFGFFANLSMLFGGCAYSFDPDFFTLFIIRDSFKKKTKWLFYNKLEIISHELCHVARFGFNSIKYEEVFAYRTSTSRFRKMIGPIFRNEKETFLLFGIVLLIVAMQVGLVFTKYIVLFKIIWLLWLLVAIFFTFLLIRHIAIIIRFKKAAKVLLCLTKKNFSLLFRCSDQEIDELSKKSTISWDEFTLLIDKNSSSKVRSKLLKEVFLK